MQSRFTTVGLAALSSDTPIAERIFASLVAQVGDELATEEGSFVGGVFYATAMALARAHVDLEKAFGQTLASEVYELLPVLERAYGIVPGARQSIRDRKRVLASRMLLLNGCSFIHVTNAFRALLGDLFVGWRTTKPAERAMFPADLGDQPQNLQSPQVPRKFVRLLRPICTNLGAPQSVGYEPFGPTSDELLVGDMLVVEPELLGRTEVVVVEDVITEGEPRVLTASFAQAHESGCAATTAPYPLWVSNQRESLIVLRGPAALDREARRQANEHAQRTFRAVSTWAVVAETTSGQAGPLQVGVSPLGATPFGAISVP